MSVLIWACDHLSVLQTWIKLLLLPRPRNWKRTRNRTSQNLEDLAQRCRGQEPAAVKSTVTTTATSSDDGRD